MTGGGGCGGYLLVEECADSGIRVAALGGPCWIGSMDMVGGNGGGGRGTIHRLQRLRRLENGGRGWEDDGKLSIPMAIGINALERFHRLRICGGDLAEKGGA